jgi:excisionase family DNA binding protein
VPDDAGVPLLLTFDETATALRTSPSTVKRLAHEGRLRTVHLGRSVRVRPCDVADFVAALATDDDEQETG